MDTGKKLVFRKLPQAAQFILDHHLEEYTQLFLEYAEEENLPLLKSVSHLSKDEVYAMSLSNNAGFLEVLINNNGSEYITSTLQRYISDKLGIIGREGILVEDITLFAFIRRKIFLRLLANYSNDHNEIIAVMEELDRFLLSQESQSFKVLVEINTEHIRQVNENLSLVKQDLLELQELADMGSFVWNLVDGTSVFTQGVMKILGINEMLTTEQFMQNVHAEDLPKINAEMEKALGGSGIYECEYRYFVNGEEKNIWSRGIVNFEGEKAVSMKGTLSDVTTKQRLLKELQDSVRSNKQAQALTHIGNWSWDIGSESITWSDEMYRIYGLEPQSETITFDKFISFIHPDDRQKRIDEIHKALNTLTAEDYIIRIINPDGTQKVLSGKGEVISSYGKAIKFVGTCQDITKEHNLGEELRQKTSQLEILNLSLAVKNADLERINKELESFNYVASHDLQEPLRKIQLFSNRILETGREDLSGSTLDYFEKINSCSRRMRLLIDDLLKFSRTTMTDYVLEPVDLNEILLNAKASLSQSPENPGFKMEVSDLPVIKGIPFQLQQLFLNLIGNSIKYSRKDYLPELKISARTVSAEMFEVQEDGFKYYHEIKLEDNGIGFEPQNADKIFGLFQRLHDRDDYNGTGIGLAICKKIVDNHHGIIRAVGKPGEGSEFYVYFPAISNN